MAYKYNYCNIQGKEIDVLVLKTIMLKNYLEYIFWII